MDLTFENNIMEFIEDDLHHFILSHNDTAKGYGVATASLLRTKGRHKDELIDNKHYVLKQMQTKGGLQDKLFWTKRGIVRLGFFIKSEQAKRFRDWAEDLILSSSTAQNPLKQRTKELEYAQRQLELFEKAFLKIGIRDKYELAIASNSAVKNETGIDFIELSGKNIVKPTNENIEIIKNNNLIGDNLEKKEKFYKDISDVLTHYPDGISQRNLLAKAGYYQSEKMRRWLHEQIYTLWDMSVIAGKGYKYTIRC
jgi:prophage antirepressor-like protein